MDKWLENFAQVYFQRSADTAHDLKAPLNVAVLNLELLRIRLAKIAKGGDEKIAGYAAAIDTELRRMAQIFDFFFLLSAPPREEGEPRPVDIAPIWRKVASSAGADLRIDGVLMARVHESRMRQATELFVDGTSRLLKSKGREMSAGSSEGRLRLMITGKPQVADLELKKVFKFYYTDPSGKADLSLAAARLIVETYGGELNATEDRDKVKFELFLPQEIDETSSNR